MASPNHNLVTTTTPPPPSTGNTPIQKRKASHIEDGDQFETPTKLSKATQGLQLIDLPSTSPASASINSDKSRSTSTKPAIPASNTPTDEFAVKDSSPTKDQPPYCYCNGDDHGDMVSCDGPACTGRWFHWECIGWTSPPSNLHSWFCKNCSPNQATPIPLSDEPEQTYCFCEQVEYGDMVACDGEDCLREWFHYACIGWKQPPDNLHDENFKWFCRECKARSKIEEAPYLPSEGEEEEVSDYGGSCTEEEEDLDGERVSRRKGVGKK